MYRARIVTVFSFALIALAVLFILALIPSYLAVQAVAPRELTDGLSPRKVEDVQAVGRAQAIIAQLLPALRSTSSPSVFIDAALAARPPGVVLNHITYAPSGNAGGSVLVVHGLAMRDKVAAYREALSKNSLFTTATVPVSALLGTGAAQFSITLGIRARP